MFKSLYSHPDSMTLAQRELEDAKRDLLAMQSQAEHAAKMVEYYQGVITRLTKYIASTEKVKSA